ncbi:hypothetical protein HOLleu_37063 [Holothuria leucospilota]|uniref:Uncharacterized protein n=1 Tax=Holothuria leucospilota TaxID=206669 RepID=A0A9Q0YMV1_HOLLE|nr:hypothetical protein HOLleu_37063 [Holothuria leucospilota]
MYRKYRFTYNDTISTVVITLHMRMCMVPAKAWADVIVTSATQISLVFDSHKCTGATLLAAFCKLSVVGLPLGFF